MRIHAINAFEGDCLLLESRGPAKLYALIDGGPRGAFDAHLREHLESVVGPTGTLEAVIVSHVDADHISGVLDLLADVEADRADGNASRLTIKDLWHNSFTRTIDHDDGILTANLQAMMSLAGRAQVAAANGSIALLGIAQGERLRRQALNLKIPLNGHAGGKLISVEDAPAPWTLGDMTFQIVGPTAANLAALKDEWVKWIEKNLDAFALGDKQAMANADKSIPNLSSIVMFGQCADGDILLTGDARGDHIIEGLEASGVLTAGSNRNLRLLKLQHHGSDRNMTADFFERLPADIYLVSADGKHGNPDLETLLAIVDAAKAQGRKPLIVSTNAPATIKQLKIERPPATFGYTLKVRSSGNHAIVVDLTTGKTSAS